MNIKKYICENVRNFYSVSLSELLLILFSHTVSGLNPSSTEELFHSFAGQFLREI